jgi:hypothetical protein
MPLQLPQLPNFQTNIPQVDPLQTYGKMLELKALQGQQQLLPGKLQEQQQQIQASQLENQQRQIDLESQQNLMKMVANGELNKYAGVQTPDGSGFDAAGAYQHLLQNGVSPKQAGEYTNSWLTVGKNQAEIRKTQGQAGEAEQNIRDKTLKQVASKLGSIGDMKLDDATKALATFKQDLVNNPKAYAGLTQQEMAELYGADLTHMDALEGHLGMGAMIADYHKAQSEAATAAQKVIPEGGGLSPDTKQQVAKDVAVATNPQIQQGKVQVAAAEGAAKAAQEAKTARGSNAALAQVSPHLVGPASAAANKAGEDYAQAQSVTQRLNAMMDAARKGNVVSYQVLPEEGTLQITTSQGVHRINQAEIQQYAGGGSLWQRMQGHLGKALSGKSIPSSVLDDMQEIQKIQSEGSQLKYNNSLKTINQTYGADFKPVQMDEMKTVQSQAGTGKSLSQAQITKAAKDHGVSVEEATRQAKAAGYSIQ